MIRPGWGDITQAMAGKALTTARGKPSDPAMLIEEVSASLRETAQEVVPWFTEQMPPMYFQDTDHATQLAHLRAIIAAKASGRPIEQILPSIEQLRDSWGELQRARQEVQT